MVRRGRPPTIPLGRRRGAPDRRRAADLLSTSGGLDSYEELGLHIAARFRPSLRERVTGLWHGADGRWEAAVRMIEARFQPIVRMSDGVPVAMEVLARLNHPARGYLPPDTFLPEIESAGLSSQLTDVVVARALSDVDSGFLDGGGMSIAVNLPLDVLLLPGALDRLEAQRGWAGMRADQITVELTESRPVLDLPGLTQAMERWRAAGYRLAIDDLGPDMPNHKALMHLPFSVVKLDKDIVQACADPAGAPSAGSFVADVIARARRAGLSVIAEGVEDDTIWTRMREMGADQAQGFLIARPLRADQLSPWLVDWAERKNRG